MKNIEIKIDLRFYQELRNKLNYDFVYDLIWKFRRELVIELYNDLHKVLEG